MTRSAEAAKVSPEQTRKGVGPMPTEAPPQTEEFSISGDELLAKTKELIHQGNVRRLIIKNEQGRTLVEFPLTVGVIGAALLPVFAAIGAIAALATRCTIVVERQEDDAAPPVV
jgi:Flp pilus assembly pilin Flp